MDQRLVFLTIQNKFIIKNKLVVKCKYSTINRIIKIYSFCSNVFLGMTVVLVGMQGD